MARPVQSVDPTRMLTPSMRREVSDAWKYGKEVIGTLMRRTGESYATHGAEVALVLSELSQDPRMIRSAILHDIPMHPNGAELLAKAPLSEEERHLVEKMHTLRGLHIDENSKDLSYVIETIVQDVRLLPLRMAHRLNDVRNLYRFPKHAQRNIARETLHMYAAIAGRMGMHSWRREMEDVCFHVVEPKTAASIAQKFASVEAIDIACLTHAKRFISEKMKAAGIDCVVDHRIKGQYSTYRKMIAKNRKFEDMTDRLALRIVVKDVPACYRGLWVVHESMHPIPGKLKDYIGAPKQNGYRSIHTVVYPLPGITDQPIEIQIRTEDMQKECEYGFASHHSYKDLTYSLQSTSARVDLFRNLELFKVESPSPKKFESVLRNYYNGDHLVVFDHANNIFHVRKPATALDFACFAYGKRSSKLKSIRINGRVRPMNTDLSDGDTVEVSFSRSIRLTADWKHACRQQTTKKLLKQFI